MGILQTAHLKTIKQLYFNNLLELASAVVSSADSKKRYKEQHSVIEVIDINTSLMPDSGTAAVISIALLTNDQMTIEIDKSKLIEKSVKSDSTVISTIGCSGAYWYDKDPAPSQQEEKGITEWRTKRIEEEKKEIAKKSENSHESLSYHIVEKQPKADYKKVALDHEKPYYLNNILQPYIELTANIDSLEKECHRPILHGIVIKKSLLYLSFSIGESNDLNELLNITDKNTLFSGAQKIIADFMKIR